MTGWLPTLLCAAALCAVLLAPMPAAASGASRLFGPDGPGTEPPHRVEKIKLGTATRDAIELPADSSFDLALGATGDLLVFSFGASGRGSERIEFDVSGRADGEWRSMGSGFAAKQAAWANYAIPLAALPFRPDRLRLRTKSTGGAEEPPARVYWGSPLLLGVPPEGPPPSVPRPNVIIVSLDTLGANHLSSFSGFPGVSPHLDAVLERSFSFRRAYAPYPNTLVSHASLFSALYPIRHLVYGGATYARLGGDTLASLLGREGYFTVAYTENAYVSSDFGFDHGFDWYDNGAAVTQEFPGTALRTFARATAWLDRYGGRAPFFLFVHTYEVHTPYRPRDDEARAFTAQIDPGYEGEFSDSYPGGSRELQHNAGVDVIGKRDLARLRALYAGEIHHLDRVVGDFVRHLGELPFADRTLVVVTADHGDEFGEHGKVGHGETLYNPVLHVPLGFSWPGKVAAGRSEVPVQLVDVMPTVLELLDVSVPPDLDGRSLLPLMRANAGEQGLARHAFAELQSAAGSCRELELPDDCGVDRYAVQNDRFKLMTSVIPYHERLYDLSEDPGETRNVAERFPEEAALLRSRLAEYVTGIPLESASPSGAAGRGPTEPAAVDDATRERLKALGYLP